MSTNSSPVAQLRDGIAAQLIGRDREASIITLALIAKEHILIVGPPGTAKSLLCRSAANLVDGARYCERLLSPTTPPEALWGPISLSALRQDRFEHITAGYASDAHILYLDEVARASAAIGDSLLHLLGPERQALIGTIQVKSPLLSCIGSTNTWPEDAAFLDRWLLRVAVQYLPKHLRRSLLTFTPPVATPVITVADLESANAALAGIAWTTDAINTLDAILADLDEAGIAISDRRLKAADKIARAAALLNGNAAVQPIDLEVLQFVMWAIPEQAATAATKVVVRANPVGARLDAMLLEVDEVTRAAVDTPTRLDAATKLEAVHKEALAAAGQPGANGRAAKVGTFVKNEMIRMKALAMGISEDKIAGLYS